MRPHLTPRLACGAVVAALAASPAFGQPMGCDPMTLFSAFTDKGNVLLEVEADRLQGAPDWKPGTGDPPISVGSAIGSVQNMAARRTGAIVIRGVQLRSASCNTIKDRWFYIVEYAEAADAGRPPPTQRSAVLMDGTVVAERVLAKEGAEAAAHLARVGAGPAPRSLVAELARPENKLQFDGPPGDSALGLYVGTMLRQGQYDQLDEELSKLLDSRERLLDGRLAYPVAMLAMEQSIQYGAPAEFVVEDIGKWRARSPRSSHAALAEAIYWRGYAWYARGSGFANTVSAKAWELFRERTARARRVLDDAEPFARGNPLWHTLTISVAWNEDRPKKEILALFADAVARDPGFQPHYFAVASRLTPRWGGGMDQYRPFVDDAVKRTQATDGASMYATLYALYANVEYDRAFGELGIAWPRMKSGLDDLIARYPSPWNLNTYARFACQAKDKEAFLKLLPKLSPRESRPSAWPTGYSLENCTETFTART